MKLVKDVSVRTYELTYLVPASVTETEVSTLKDKITQLIARYKGKLIVAEDWGKKNLAYRIRHKSQHQTQAHYTHLSLEMAADQAVAFEKEIYLENSIMRHLFAKIEDKKPVVAKPVVAKTEVVKTEVTKVATEKPKPTKKVAVPTGRQAKKE